MKSITFCLLLITLTGMTGALQAGEPSASDEEQIRTLMLHTWDQPEAPLQIQPLVIVSDFALASWIQGDRGGRALLAKREQIWQVLLCAGDGLKKSDLLVQSGVPTNIATELVTSLGNAEIKLPKDTQQKFSLFGKTMLMHEHHDAHKK